jgi:hypothetical protein
MPSLLDWLVFHISFSRLSALVSRTRFLVLTIRPLHLSFFFPFFCFLTELSFRAVPLAENEPWQITNGDDGSAANGQETTTQEVQNRLQRL